MVTRKKSVPKDAKKESEVIVKKAEKAEKVEVVEKAKELPFLNGKYHCAVGRRKCSVAQVRIFEDSTIEEDKVIVNGREFQDYFPLLTLQNIFFGPLRTIDGRSKLRVSVFVKGGGRKGQVEAAKLGVARALVKLNQDHKKILKDLGFLTRDSRIVERKKPGLKKARRAPQWQKR